MSNRTPVPARRVLAVIAGLCLALVPYIGSTSADWSPTTGKAQAYGELDCNGQSPIQKPVKRSMLCTDIKGRLGPHFKGSDDGKFYDNGLYIGHDEPDVDYLSNKPNSANDVTWVLKLPVDPKAAPTIKHPGHDVSHFFELSIAPWFSMDVCDPGSYPQLPCTPKSDANTAQCTNGLNCPANSYPGGGSAFVEMQFYPPGEPPFADAESCDDTHWCAALNIDSLECTELTCNQNCEEPVNFAFITKNGIPTGPPSPQDSNLYTFTPNEDTLLMKPGDNIRIHMWDAKVPNEFGERALEVKLTDLRTHKVGWMQASGDNGFMNTSIIDCSGEPFDFEPEFNTAKVNHFLTWGAGTEDISTSIETGHFEGCTALSQPAKVSLGMGISDTYWNSCKSPYENSGKDKDGPTVPETGDAACFPKGDTHGVLHSAPDIIDSCNADWYQNGDLDFDGSPYWPEWSTGTKATAKFPSAYFVNPPTTSGKQYNRYYFTTDVALSEYNCSDEDLEACTVPPDGPGHFYPYWSLLNHKGSCGMLFGNVYKGKGIRNFGRMKEYGKDMYEQWGYPQFLGKIYTNGCKRGAA